MQHNLFTTSPSVQSMRILYTPSPFARASLLHLQEVGSLTAIRPHTSKREKLQSYLCFAVEDGEGRLVYEGKEYALKAGDVVFIDCRKAYSHSTGTAPKLWSLRWCHFYGPSMPAIYAKYCERGGLPVIHPDDIQVYQALFSDIYSLASSSDYIRDMRINEKLNILLTLLMESSWHCEARSSASKKMGIGQVKAYLDEHYKEKLSLTSVANVFFIDKYYLARLFKEQYGVTLVTYLQQVRITHAKQMLRFTDKSIEEIGLECGIGELNYFSRVFKKLEGVSPSAYRRMW
ncbi:MAG: helix-turn-helix domain-containing protein [Coprococcus sp.]